MVSLVEAKKKMSKSYI